MARTELNDKVRTPLHKQTLVRCLSALLFGLVWIELPAEAVLAESPFIWAHTISEREIETLPKPARFWPYSDFPVYARVESRCSTIVPSLLDVLRGHNPFDPDSALQWGAKRFQTRISVITQGFSYAVMTDVENSIDEIDLTDHQRDYLSRRLKLRLSSIKTDANRAGIFFAVGGIVTAPASIPIALASGAASAYNFFGTSGVSDFAETVTKITTGMKAGARMGRVISIYKSPVRPWFLREQYIVETGVGDQAVIAICWYPVVKLAQP